jgi:uncharacterized BrkB/YihY/UPF0761 family membrane protein
MGDKGHPYRTRLLLLLLLLSFTLPLLIIMVILVFCCILWTVRIKCIGNPFSAIISHSFDITVFT